ncbi:putative transcriptional regulator, partial [Dysosmobacter welbionis]
TGRRRHGYSQNRVGQAGLSPPPAAGRRTGGHDRPLSGPRNAVGAVRWRTSRRMRGDQGGAGRVRDQKSGRGAGL